MQQRAQAAIAGVGVAAVLGVIGWATVGGSSSEAVTPASDETGVAVVVSLMPASSTPATTTALPSVDPATLPTAQATIVDLAPTGAAPATTAARAPRAVATTPPAAPAAPAVTEAQAPAAPPADGPKNGYGWVEGDPPIDDSFAYPELPPVPCNEGESPDITACVVGG